jgi:hypothetical protein
MPLRAAARRFRVGVVRVLGSRFGHGGEDSAGPRKRPPAGGLPRARGDQLRLLSTSLLALIQGIMARSFSPTTSIECSAGQAAAAQQRGRAGTVLQDEALGVFAGLDVLQRLRIAALVSSVTIFGPVTYSPYSALLLIE